MFTLSDAKSACLMDAQTLFTTKAKGDDFIKVNAPQVQDLMILWMSLCEDAGCTDYSIGLLHASVVHLGLIAVVSSLGDNLDEILLTLETSDVRPYQVTSLLTPGSIAGEMLADILHRNVEWDDALHRVIQLCVFPERFTYAATSGAILGIAGFRESNKHCKIVTSNWSLWPGNTVLDLVKSEFSRILSGYWHIRKTDSTFSSGSCAGGLNTLAKKLHAIASTTPTLYGDIWSLLPGGRNTGRRGLPVACRYPSLIEVPKKLLKKRVIAPERVDVAFYAQAVLACLRRVLIRNGSMQYINEQNQQVNRDLAATGSLTGVWATLDLSSASDTISRGIFFRACPDELRDLFAELMSELVLLPDGNYSALWMTFSSGHPLTWLLEACWFLAIGRTACVLAGEKDPDACVYAYGDDIIIRTEYYQTCIELLEAMGHTVNARKSYSRSHFRESCGAYAYNGVVLDLVFWPRSEVITQTDRTLNAVTLQRKAYALHLTGLERAARDLAFRLYPKMTRSCPYELRYADIWDDAVSWYVSDRSRHVCTKSTWPKTERDRLVEHYVYYQYLLIGPLYASSLDELLGVSSSRLAAAADQGRPTIDLVVR